MYKRECRMNIRCSLPLNQFLTSDNFRTSSRSPEGAVLALIKIRKLDVKKSTVTTCNANESVTSDGVEPAISKAYHRKMFSLVRGVKGNGEI